MITDTPKLPELGSARAPETAPGLPITTTLGPVRDAFSISIFPPTMTDPGTYPRVFLRRTLKIQVEIGVGIPPKQGKDPE